MALIPNKTCPKSNRKKAIINNKSEKKPNTATTKPNRIINTCKNKRAIPSKVKQGSASFYLSRAREMIYKSICIYLESEIHPLLSTYDGNYVYVKNNLNDNKLYIYNPISQSKCTIILSSKY